MNNLDDFNTDFRGGKKRSAKKKAAAGGVLGAAAAAIILLFGVRTCKAQGAERAAKARRNTLELAKMYMERAQYDRALDKLDELLIQNRNDEEARLLMEQILLAKGEGTRAFGIDGRQNDGADDSGTNSNDDEKGADGLAETALSFGNEGQGGGSKDSARTVAKGGGRENDFAAGGAQRNRSNAGVAAGNGASASQNGGARTDLNADGKKPQNGKGAVQSGVSGKGKKEGASGAAKDSAAGSGGAADGIILSKNPSHSQKEEDAAQQRSLEERRKKEDAARKDAETKLSLKNETVKKEVNAVNAGIAQGKSALKSGNTEEALNDFRAVEKNLPLSAGEPSFSAGKYSEIASALYDSAQKSLSPAEKKKLMEKASEYAQKSVSLNSNDASAQFILGMDAYAKENYAQALSSFQKAAAADKQNYVYFYNLGRAQFMAKKYADAKASFAKTAEINAEFAPARYNHALSCLKLGDETSALASFRKAYGIDPRYEKAHLEEARLLSRQKDYAGAAAAYQNVLKINGNNRDALQELGSLYYQTEKYADSENAFKKSLALLPSGRSDPLTAYNLSTVLAAQNKNAEALSHAKKAYEAKDLLKEPALQVNVLYNYALLLDKSGRTGEAASKYEEVLGINPKHVKSKINLGVLRMAKNPPDADGALSFFLAAYAEEKNNFEVNNNLGSAYLAKKDFKNSILYFKNAIALDGENTEAQSNLAKAYAGAGEYENAKTAFTEVLQRSPSDWESYVELAKVYIALKDSAGAAACLKTVKEKQPSFRHAEVDALLKSLMEDGGRDGR